MYLCIYVCIILIAPEYHILLYICTVFNTNTLKSIDKVHKTRLAFCPVFIPYLCLYSYIYTYGVMYLHNVSTYVHMICLIIFLGG